jgi:CMP/dCMP kinase
MFHVSIAIDGPAGAGKSTVAKLVARRLKFLYVDTGAMYRAISWIAVKTGCSISDEAQLLKEIEKSGVRFERNADGLLDVYIHNQNVTFELRSPEISDIVSQIAVHPGIRALLTKWQRQFAAKYSVVMDGRDIGTIVLPDANLKVFLTANLRERAKRRMAEMTRKGYSVSLEEIMQAMAIRDERDASRDVAPLKMADDAIEIDSTNKSVDDIVSEILSLVERIKK